MDKFSYPIYLITAMLLLTGIPQLSCKPIYPGEAPAPTLFDCMPSFNSMFYCLSFVEPGSNLTRPDPLCCPGFAAVVNKNPICLCQFLANTSVVPVHVDVQRSLMLPNVCNVNTLPPSACSIVGFPIPPSSAPAEPAPMSHVPPPHPLAPQLRTLPTAPHPPAQEPPPQHSPLFTSPRNRMPLVLGLGIGVPVLLVFVGTMVLFQRKNIINRPELELPPRGAIDRNDHVYRSPAHLLQNYSASPDIDEQVPAAALCFYLNSERQDQQSTAHTINSNRKTRFNYEELFLATNHFSRNTLLGEGGFGNVHKGVLDDGKHVAIKQLKLDSRQGEREFQTEVETVSRVHHRHLVSLVGYCISGAKRLLVYEFVPNDSLEFHLHGAGRPCMSWETRMKIAFGCSKGLAYLHEDCQPKIIHRDIKSSNILLDENFEAKVADFGLARFYLDGETHISTRVMGTFGYLAPEYALTGKITEKSDVFSFGVVLLELITGHRPIDKTNAYHGDHIINWARPLLKEALDNNNFDSVADPRLHKNYDSIEITRMVTCAFACVHHLARCRPNMSQVVCALEGVLSLDDLVCDTEKDDKMKKKL